MRFPETLRTARLTLRQLAEPDLPTLAREIGRWEVARWLINVPHPYTREDAESWLDITRRKRREFALLHFVIVPDGWEEIAGGISLALDRQGPGEAEMGYWLAPAAWGQGFATEAARAMVACGFRDAGVPAIVGVADPANHGSNAVLRKAGLRLVRVEPDYPHGLRGGPAPANIHRITAEEFEAAHVQP